MVSKKMKKRQDDRRQKLASRFFEECTDKDFLVVGKGGDGIVCLGNTVVTNVQYSGGLVRHAAVIRYDSIHGATYDRSPGAEEVTLHATFGDVTWSIYEARAFVLQLLREIIGDAGVSSLAEALERTAKAKA